MASPVKLYQREMHSNIGFYATWLPGDPIEVGDVGVLVDGGFRRMTSLEELGVSCDVRTGVTRQELQLTSTRGTKLTASAGASVPTIVKAEVAIEFSHAGAFVFHASALRPQNIMHTSTVAASIVDAYRGGRWQQDWLLVEAVHIADSATIIVSVDNSSKIVLEAAAAGVVPAISLADPKIEFSVAATQGQIVHIVGGRSLHPLYSCLRLKRSFFAEPSLRPVRGVGTAKTQDVFARPSIDDLLDS